MRREVGREEQSVANDAKRQIMGFFHPFRWRAIINGKFGEAAIVRREDGRGRQKMVRESVENSGTEEENAIRLLETRDAINLRRDDRDWDPSVTVAITVCSRISIDYRCLLYLSLLLNTNGQGERWKGEEG